MPDKINECENRSNWRTSEIEEYSNLHLIHPVSAVLTGLFARWGWTPNSVSGLGMLSALAASWCFYHYQSTLMSALGMLFMLGWHILDGADGQLARLTGQTSEIGKVIDGVCDHLGFGMVYFALALALQPEYGVWIWLLAVAAGLSHAVQAGALEFHRDNYDCWVHGKRSKCVPPLGDIELDYGEGFIAGLLSTGHLYYIRLQYLVSEADNVLIYGELSTRDHPGRSDLEGTFRRLSLNTVRLWSWLSSNKRTIAVSLFCLVKLPILFFIYEIIVLNGLMIWLCRRQRCTNRELRKALVHNRV